MQPVQPVQPVRSRVEYIDIAVNLTDDAFGRDRDDVLARAAAAGVTRVIATGTSERTSRAAADLAVAHPGVVWATAGVHPHDAKRCGPGTIDALRALAALPSVVAIGECGLDYNRDFSPRPAQRQWLEAQLALAAELRMPVFLHERDAHADLLTLVGRYRDRLPGAVVHCFTGVRDELRAYLDLDLHIGITGWICDERRGTHLHALVPEIPPDRLMIETDAPYLLPRTMCPRPRSRRNEPAYLVHVAATVAACRGVPIEVVAADTTRTAQALFGVA